MILDANSKIFIIYVTIWEQEKITINFIKKVQIKTQNKAQVGDLLFVKISMVILAEVSNYSNIFWAKNTAKFFEHIIINDYTIELIKGKLLLFGPIYSLNSGELKILKTYIETNLANSFI